MELSVRVTEHVCVLTVTGDVGAADVPAFRRRLVELLEVRMLDVVLDLRGCAHVDPALFPALASARTRAKVLRCRLAVADTVDGATARGLHARGLHERIPVHADVDAALAGLADVRAAREKLTVAFAAGGDRSSAAEAARPVGGSS